MSDGLHIISTRPITAYYEEASFFNAEIFVLKGKNALGKQFIMPRKIVMIIAATIVPFAIFRLTSLLQKTIPL